MKRKKRIENILLNNRYFFDWIIKVKDISSLHSGHNDFDGKNETHFSITLRTKKIHNIRLTIGQDIEYSFINK